MNTQQAIMRALSEQRNAALDQVAMLQAELHETKKSLGAANQEITSLRSVMAGQTAQAATTDDV